MHPSDREQLWSQIDRINGSIGELRIRIDNPACRCGDRECDDCAIVRGDERDLEDLERQRRELMRTFPEEKYADET